MSQLVKNAATNFAPQRHRTVRDIAPPQYLPIDERVLENPIKTGYNQFIMINGPNRKAI